MRISRSTPFRTRLCLYERGYIATNKYAFIVTCDSKVCRGEKKFRRLYLLTYSPLREIILRLRLPPFGLWSRTVVKALTRYSILKRSRRNSFIHITKLKGF